MALKIDLYANDGSPIGVIPPDIYGRGVGGAELAMMSWAETMAERDHLIRIYNDPVKAGIYDEVEYLPQADFEPHDKRDVFIIYRSPNHHIRIANGLKIHWSTDQYTIGDFGRDIFPFVDKVVCISPFHVDYHRQRYGVENGKVGHIDLGVRLGDYDQDIEKIPGRCIFCSVPDRGLELLHAMWPQIKERVPHASLVITSDYRLWGGNNPNNHRHRLSWLHQEDVVFLGKVERARLVQEQLAAECHSYPSTYDELFCISAAECQVAGAWPVTTTTGALKTTNEWGTITGANLAGKEGQWTFVSAIANYLSMLERPRRAEETEAMQKQARIRFDWQRICGQWERLIETGEFA